MNVFFSPLTTSVYQMNKILLVSISVSAFVSDYQQIKLEIPCLSLVESIEVSNQKQHGSYLSITILLY